MFANSGDCLPTHVTSSYRQRLGKYEHRRYNLELLLYIAADQNPISTLRDSFGLAIWRGRLNKAELATVCLDIVPSWPLMALKLLACTVRHDGSSMVPAQVKA